MSQRDAENLTMVVCGVVVLICIAALLAANVAHSQTPAERAQTVLAQAAIAECGWTASDCHAAVWWTLQRQQTDRGDLPRTIEQVARDYCAAWRSSRPRARWVRGLPDSQPRYLRHWWRVYERAGAFLAGDLRDPCRGYTLDFGDVHDTRRGDGSSWVEVECGDTGGQHFGRWERVR